MTRKWIEVNDPFGDQYSVDKNIKFKTPMLRSYLQNYSDAYIVVKVTINRTTLANNNMPQKDVAFKNNSPIRLCI